MTKKEFVRKVAGKTGLPVYKAGPLVDAMLEVIVETVVSGERVVLTGFGVFEPRFRSGRLGRNPKTGEQVQVSDKYYPAFKASTRFDERVAEAFN